MTFRFLTAEPASMRRFALLAALVACTFAPFAQGQGVLNAQSLALLAPAADPVAIETALSAIRCAQAHGQGTNATRLTLIDYSKPSLEPRLWVFDLAQGKLLFEEVVAHGRNSGTNMTTSFSNVEGSLQTSLGLFLTGETYMGGNGYSLRLDGLDKGLNDRAMQRAIVIHGAPYVDPVAARKQGRLGRSFGCPAVRTAVATPLIDAIKGGNFVFSYYPSDALASRQLADCPAAAGGATTVATAAP
jgi:hypothetical protein